MPECAHPAFRIFLVRLSLGPPHHPARAFSSILPVSRQQLEAGYALGSFLAINESYLEERKGSVEAGRAGAALEQYTKGKLPAAATLG